MRKVLIGAFIIGAVFVGSALALRNRPIGPDRPFYGLKRVGEWLDVNFLIFGAPEKQAWHLTLARRRLDEYLALPEGSATAWRARRMAASYELELARTEFMAEQLALLDHRFIPNIEAVYKATFQDQQTLARYLGKRKSLADFISAAGDYNRQSIKVLLHKHQHQPSDTAAYKGLVVMRLDDLENSYDSLTTREKWRVDLAKKALAQGKEIEWAYDLMYPVPLR